MKRSRINENVKLRTDREKVKESGQTRAELSSGARIAAASFTALVGIWVAACFIGGLIASGGPLAMLKSWFAAVSGM